MHSPKKNELVPYEQLAPGFEAVYTGETSASPVQETEMITTLATDPDGNLYRQWSTIPWTFPGKEAEWDDETKVLNEMQAKLGPLNDRIRQIRAHIGVLVPCDSGVPVSIDELLNAIGEGELDEPSFHNGCWSLGLDVWWEQKTTQPLQAESMGTIHAVLTGYLVGKTKADFVGEYPHGEGFINRAYAWLGPESELSEVQRLMMGRMLLTIDYFAHGSDATPCAQSSDESEQQRPEDVVKELFSEEGRGACLDAEISEKAKLPRIYPRWNPKSQENLERLESPQKKELYRTCCAIASGVHTLSDCHHNTFRIIENWIHGIGAGKWRIPTRKAGTERERMGHLLFGYVLGLDRWLMGVPMQFLLLDLGHLDIGFEVKNEVLRVYAYLGEEHTPVKEWLAASLWHNLMYSYMDANNPAGLVNHQELLKRACELGISLREWMDLRLRENHEDS